jgi:hypothetical protein
MRFAPCATPVVSPKASHSGLKIDPEHRRDRRGKDKASGAPASQDSRPSGRDGITLTISLVLWLAGSASLRV